MKIANAKKMMTGLATAMLAGMVCLPAALADDAAPSAEAAVGLYSKYVWRGYEFSKDSMVIQPSVTVGYKGFGVNLWGNLDTNQYDRDTESFNWNETDLTLSYDGSAGMVGYSLGYIYYDTDAGDTQEIYAGLGLDTLLAPTFTIYKDIADVPGWYATLEISHSFPIKESLALDLGARIGYLDNDLDGAAEFSGLHDGLISAAMSFPINDMITITPELYYSFPLSSDAEDEIKDYNAFSDDDSYVFGGVAVSFAF